MTARTQAANRGKPAERAQAAKQAPGSRTAAKQPDAQRSRLAVALPTSARERVLLAVVVVLLVAGLVWYFGGASSGSDNPYADPIARGTITLYDASGNAETRGSVNTHPFAAKAMSSIPAPPAYAVTGATATLLAYVPRQGASAELWSGDTLTASTNYTDYPHPTVTGTSTDFSLADFISELPPHWDGAIELRIYLGAPGQETMTSTYPVADIKVTGDTWTLMPNESGTS